MLELKVLEHCISARDGTRLACREWCSGDPARTPILCLPGLSRNADDFDQFARRCVVEHGRRVFAVDYRGRGNSGWDSDPKNYRPETYLDDLRHLLIGLNVHHVMAVGTSMGGLLAMAMGVAMPSALAGVVLNDVGPDVDGTGLSSILPALSNPPSFKEWDEAERYLRTLMRGLSEAGEDDWRRVTHATFRRDSMGMLNAAWDPHIVDTILAGAEIPDLWPLFRSLRSIPILAFRGETSDILSSRCFEAMKVEKPDLFQVTVPNRGHAPILNEPECENALDDFFQSLP